MSQTLELLAAWRAIPDLDRSLALCRALAADPGSSHARPILAEVAPQISTRMPNEVSLQLALGRVCIDCGDMFLADAVLKRVLQAAGSDARVWRMLGEVFLRAGNARDADTAFEGAIARGASDDDTLRWREKAKSTRQLQDAGGHGLVAAEVARWLTAPEPMEAPDEGPSSQMTIVREPNASDLAAVAGQAPAPRVLGRGDVWPQRPFEEAPQGGESFAMESFVSPPPVLMPMPAEPAAQAAAPPRAPQPVAPSPLDEESMDVDVLKLPEGDKLDAVLEALREGAGLVIEEPTAFYQLPVRPPEPEPEAQQAPFVPHGATVAMPQASMTPTLMPHGMVPAPNADASGRPLPARPAPPAAMRTMMMPTAADLVPEPEPPRATSAAVAKLPPPRPLTPAPRPPQRAQQPPIAQMMQQPAPGSSPRVESPTGPSGVIINAAMAGPPSSSQSPASMAVAPTVRGDSLIGPAPQIVVADPPAPMGPPGAAPMGPPGAAPMMGPPLGLPPLGAAPLAPQPKKSGGGVGAVVVVLVVALCVAAAALYVLRSRGIVKFAVVAAQGVSAGG
ncbi:MAG TPA: hypothetical protein VGM56_24905 [Byssovorax sp.]|jgi:hypothetical protein